jgi:16S rRNA processing protein RimM
VRALRQGKKGPQVAFDGITDRAGAESIRGAEVFVSRRRELEEGEYWPGDLVGLEVRPGGGEVVAVAHGPAQDRLVVERSGTRFEIPFVSALVPVVDIDAGYVEIVEIDGLS